MKTFFQNKALQKLPLRFILLFVVVVLCLYFFGKIIDEVFWEEEKEMDIAVANFVAGKLENNTLTTWMKFAAELASRNFLLVAYTLVAGFYLFIKKDKLLAMAIGLIGISGYIINHFLKLLFKRVRPTEQLVETLKNFSFPSGHSTSAFIFYGLLIYLLWQQKIARGIKISISILLVFIALCIGFSRVYLRVHYITDVLAGFSIGLAWLLMSIWLVEHLKKRYGGNRRY